MRKINNIHDKLFREAMGQKDVAGDFMSNYLSQDVLQHVVLDVLEKGR